MAVADEIGLGVSVGVLVGVALGVTVAVSVAPITLVGVGVWVSVVVWVLVGVTLGVSVSLGGAVGIGVSVGVGVAVGVTGQPLSALPTAALSALPTAARISLIVMSPLWSASPAVHAERGSVPRAMFTSVMISSTVTSSHERGEPVHCFELLQVALTVQASVGVQDWPTPAA